MGVRAMDGAGRWRAVLALSAATLFWSGNYVAGRALRGEVDPLTLNALRWGICLLLFLPLVGGRLLRHARVLRREWRLMAGLGATGIAGFNFLAYSALRGTTAVNALLISALAPMAIMAAAALTGQEGPTRRQWLGSLVSLAGALVLVTRGGELATLRANWGDLLMVAGVVVWAAYSLLLRRRPADLPQDVTLAASIVAGLLLLLPFLLAFAPSLHFEATPATLGAVLYVAVFASLLAFLLWSYGVNAIGPSRAGQFVYLMPVFGSVLAVTLLGERIVTSQVVGAALVAGGILLAQRRA